MPKRKANVYKNIKNLGDYACKRQCVSPTGPGSGHDSDHVSDVAVTGPSTFGMELDNENIAPAALWHSPPPEIHVRVRVEQDLGQGSMVSGLPRHSSGASVVLSKLSVQEVSERRARTFALITQPSSASFLTPAAGFAQAPGPQPPPSLPELPSQPFPVPPVRAAVLETTHENSDDTCEEPYVPRASGLPPTVEEARAAHADLVALLQPRRRNGKAGHLPFNAGDDRLYLRLTQVKMLLWNFTCPGTARLGWVAASLATAHAHEGGITLAKTLRQRACAFIADRHSLPFETRGIDSKDSLLDNEDLKQEVIAHLQSVGKYVRALDIVEFLAETAVQERLGLKKTVSLSTAQSWMHELGYRWAKTPSGQFVDGHERSDVVGYRQKTFLPRMAALELHAPQYSSKDGSCTSLTGSPSLPSSTEPSVAPPSPSEPLPSVSLPSRAVPGPAPVPVTQIPPSLPPTAAIPGPALPEDSRPVMYLYHDESIFYAHDRRQVRWVAPGETPTPRKKGEGHSLMAADFISSLMGFFKSKDGLRDARVIWRSGKNRDGYFTNQDILDQLTIAMDICQSDYPEYRVVFVLDNASTHLKRADDALSARQMSKKPTQAGNPLFGVQTNVIGPDGKPVYGPDGKLLKQKIRMRDAVLPDGRPQPLYFPDGHPQAGVFKGMTRILEERGFTDVAGLRAECPKFKCAPGGTRCCTRRLLFEQPDFRDAESLVETHCKARGFGVVFLPKFHCELNPIEQCWCAAKRTYREFPPSSLEADLERNVRASLDSVSLLQIRRFCNRALRFMDAYRKGLTGTQAAWAAKKYSGHRTLPHNILAQFDEAHPSPVTTGTSPA